MTQATEAGQDQDKIVEYLRKVTADLRRSRQRVRDLEYRAEEPIAIVGMACRYPGGIARPEDLWRVVAEGRETAGPFPEDRGWNLAALYHPDPDHAGTSLTRTGGFLADVGGFDAGFFGISPREALAMDPQQRLLLEAAWTALEHGGFDPRSLRESDTGVFVGASTQEYGPRVQDAPEALEGVLLTGNSLSVMSGRIAYHLGLVGPAMTVDTACSSSLVAAHLAVRALRSGECSTALVGGVAVMSTPSGFIEFSRQRGLSPDGRCRAFAAAADGTGWAEGVGVLVLERLGTALERGHRIHALIRGTAVNQDGASNGLTAPNGPSQQRVIRAALADARIAASDVDAVEAHGTGTKLGDPIEAEALIATYGRERTGGEPLWLGSVKSNIGHTQAAAGIAGIIKMAQAMRAGELPATLHVDEPTPHVDWSSGSVALLTENRPWATSEDRPRRAGISAFGISGTNAHLILEQPPTPVPTADPAAEPQSRPSLATVPWLISAQDDAALRIQARQLAAFADENPETSITDIASSLVRSRTAFTRRAVALGADRAELTAALRSLADGGEHVGLMTTDGSSNVTDAFAAVFTGQGSQRVEMGRELYGAFPVFATALDEACAAFDPLLGGSLRAAMFEGVGPSGLGLDDTHLAQCAIFAFELALYRLVESFGLRPTVLAGHSIGEITAAHVAGVMSLPDAARLVEARGRLMQALPAGGVMVALEATEEEVRALIDSPEVDIAAVNGPRAVVVSGTRAPVYAVQEALKAQGRRTKRLTVSHAFHSPLMEPMLEEFAAVVAAIELRAPRIPLVSARTGRLAEGEHTEPGYWVEHVRGTVRFSDALSAIAGSGARTVLEIGPDAVLTGLADRDTLTPIALQRADRPEPDTVLVGLARLWTLGHAVDWNTLLPRVGPLPDLPTYPFRHQTYWLDAPEGRPERGRSMPAVPTRAPESAEIAPLGAELRAQPRAEQLRTLRRLVREQTALVLGYPEPAGLDAANGFANLGLTSLTAVELRTRLAARTGLSLPTALVYDHPTPDALAEHLRVLLSDQEPAPDDAIPTGHAAADEEADPLVIVGMACRYPGGAASPEEFWSLIAAQRDAVGPFPADRGWDLEALYDPDPDRSGTSYVREGGFLYDSGEFDADFFGISPREALAMDPQQRVLLELAWEVFERAGVDPTSVRGSRTGVFVGASWQAYGPELRQAPASVEGHLLTGNAPSIMSGRLAYQFGLNGPALTVDTACSSALVALHLAARAVRSGECEAALVGGVSIMSTPGPFTEFSRQRGLAADARCKAFAEAADGTDFGEGAGLLLVERLSRARELGHRVWAVVRGTAVNQDGASNGLTAPNGSSQQRVIRAALADARIAASDVDTVEAHGTGTRLGDPIEAEALIATYGRERAAADRPLWLGSVKSNIGHSQHAAGVAGIIKMVMAMRAGVLPATLHVDAPTSRVDWSADTVQLLTSARPWPGGAGRTRRAGVSAFGFSGTNAHVIIEEPEYAAEPKPESEPAAPATGLVPWPVSARTATALRAQAERLAAHLSVAETATAREAAVAGELERGRAALPQRAVVLGAERAELLAGLRALAEGRPHPGLVEGSVGTSRDGAVFVFPGQGAQWIGMGAELIEQSAAFAATIERIEHALAPHVDWSLIDVLRGEGPEGTLERVDVVQPASFAMALALAEFWHSLGVAPTAVLGHSQGEVAAACFAGILDLEDAARVVAIRSRLIAERLSSTGGMLSIAASERTVAKLTVEFPDLSVAVVNGPESTVVAGPVPALESVLAKAVGQGLRARILPVDYASHSSQVEVLRAELIEGLAGITPQIGDIPMFSTARGEWLSGTDADATYWYDNLREPVRFAAAVEALLADGHDAFIECGPHPVLTPGIEQTAAARSVLVIPSLRRDSGGPDELSRSAASAWVGGLPVNWHAVLAESAEKTHVDLPTYAFQRKRYWLGSDPARREQTATTHELGQSDAAHPLLAAAIELPDGGLLLTGRLGPDSAPIPSQSVHELELLPDSTVVELAAAAGRRVGAACLAELSVLAPIAAATRASLQIRVSVSGPDDEARRSVAVSSRAEPRDGTPPGSWIQHAVGTLRPAADAAAAIAVPRSPESGAEPVHAALAVHGLDYGNETSVLRGVRIQDGRIEADVALDDIRAGQAAAYAVHPTLLEAALRPILATAQDGVPRAAAWREVRIHSVGARSLRVALTRIDQDSWSLEAHDEAGRAVLSADAVTVRPTSAEELRATMQHSFADELYRLDWIRVPSQHASTPPQDVVLAEIPALVAEATGNVEAALIRATDEARIQLQSFLADSRLAEGRLVVRTRGAVSVLAGEPVDPVLAAVSGLIRSAITENPGRILLVDTGDEPPEAWLPAVLAAAEPQLAVRGDALFAPRLVPADEPAPTPGSPRGDWQPEGTVLITGGTGALGALAARHLVKTRGVQHLLLVSRRGLEAPGAADLVDELTGMGAEVTVAAVDCADRDQLTTALALIPDRHPLRAVIHTAGVLDDAVVSSLTEDQLAKVLRAKAVSAWHLHSLTRHLDLDAFVLYSSVAGFMGGPGQGNYAAANSFLDALAESRAADGLPGTSLAWGLWRQPSGMTGHLTDVDLRRMSRGGIRPLSPEVGMRLFDAALAQGQALTVPAKLDLAALRVQGDALPPVLSRLVDRPQASPAEVQPETDADAADFARRFADLPEPERTQSLLDAVRGVVGAVLGLEDADAVAADRAFKDLGFDSLLSVELRNRLGSLTGIGLPTSLAFDYPTPGEVAAFIAERLAPAESEEDGIRRLLNGIPTNTLRASGLLDLLLDLANGPNGPEGPNGPDSAAPPDPFADIDAMDAAELLRLATADPFDEEEGSPAR